MLRRTNFSSTLLDWFNEGVKIKLTEDRLAKTKKKIDLCLHWSDKEMRLKEIRIWGLYTILMDFPGVQW